MSITVITTAVAALGCVVLAMLLSLGVQLTRDLRLQKHRSKAAGVADLLNHGAVVDDGVIVCKNGAFLACWFYRGADNASATDKEREHVSFQINRALARLGNGWMTHTDAMRRPAPGYSDPASSHFPDPVSAAVDAERRAYFESLGTMYEGGFVFSVTWFPPVLAERKFVELMFDDERDEVDAKSRTAQLLESFKTECRNIQNAMSGAVDMERLCAVRIQNEDGSVITHDQQLQWLQYCVTGLNHPVALPKNPMYIDALIGGQELYTGVVPKMGRKYIQVVGIDGFPHESSPGMLSALAELSMEYRWSTRFIFMDPHEALSHLEKFRKKWRQKIRGFMDQMFRTGTGAVNEDAVDMVQDASAAMAETNSGLVAQGYYTSVVVLMDESRERVEKAALRIERAINSLGFTARVETINTLDAYLGSIPGHGVENVRRPLLHSLNVADLLPTSSIWPGSSTAPSPLLPPNSPALMQCVTAGNTPLWLNLDVRDLGHWAMFGQTRGGKSTHIGILALQFLRYRDARVLIFEKGMSSYPTCAAVGGKHFILGGDSGGLNFAPLSKLNSRSRRAWAMDWVSDLLRLNNVTATPAQRTEIGKAIVNMHESGSKTLSEFVLLIQDEEIREALSQYTVDGTMGHLLDAEEDGFGLSNFMSFELGELMNLGEKYALPVLLYLFRRIEEGLDGRPTLLILDEAWLMLRHPVFKERIRDWLKTLAKLNCRVGLATQNLSDARDSGILDVIVESTATKIFLPNSSATSNEETVAMYRRMGLNDRQIELVAKATLKQDYYLVCENGRRMYQLALGPLALAFVGATDPESISAVRKLEAAHGPAWVDEWLVSRGLDPIGVAA